MKDYRIEMFLNRSRTEKIPAGSPQTLWAHFHRGWQLESLTAEILADEVRQGHSFAACFEGRKIRQNFQRAYHVALDFDCADERASFDHLLKDWVIRLFASFLYYTPSSDPPRYKSRVVFLLDDPIPDVDEYEEILAAFAYRYPDSDQSTTDAARFFYGSAGTEIHAPWGVLPRDIVWNTLKQYKEDHKPKRVDYKPVETNTAEVADALKHIPVQQDYLDWLKICMAVHSEFPDATGIGLLESWSPGYPGEIAAKFKTFHENRGRAVTIRTLFKLARDNGWKPKEKA